MHPFFSSYPGNRSTREVRDPAERFLSHFYYSFGQSWTAGLRIRAYAEDVVGYLHDDAALLETPMLWRDGNAAVAWFAGLTVDYGMGLSAEDDARRLHALTVALARDRLKKLEQTASDLQTACSRL